MPSRRCAVSLTTVRRRHSKEEPPNAPSTPVLDAISIREVESCDLGEPHPNGIHRRRKV
jgi:hypothetical protein